MDLVLNKKVTLGDVIGQEYKSEVNALACEMAGGANSRSKEAFGNYKKALKTFTDNLTEEAKATAEVERKRCSLRCYIYISIWDTTQVTSYIHMGTYPPAKFFEKQGAAGVPGLVRMTNRVLWVGG